MSGLSAHYLLGEDIRAEKYSDDELRHITYPKMRAWLSSVIEEDTSIVSASMKAAAWKDIYTIIEALPPRIVRELATEQSILVVLLMNQLDLDVLSESAHTWQLTCKTLARCLHACGNLLWQDQSTVALVGDCLHDLLGIATKCFAEPNDTFGGLIKTMQPSESSQAQQTAYLCLSLLSDLMTTSSGHWQESQMSSFAFCIRNYVANGAQEFPELEKAIESLLITSAKRVRSHKSEIRLRALDGVSVVGRFGGRAITANVTDNLLTFDEELVSELSKITNKEALSTKIMELVVRLHAAICTCPCPQDDELSRRHRGISRLVQALTAYNLPNRCAENMLECMTPFMCTQSACLKGACKVYLENYTYGLKMQLNASSRDVSSLPSADGLESPLDFVKLLMVYGLNLGVLCQAPLWFVSGFSKTVMDAINEDVYAQFLICDRNPLGPAVGCSACQYVFGKVYSCIEIASALLVGTENPQTKAPWDARAISIQQTIHNLLQKMMRCIDISIGRAANQRVSQICLYALRRRMNEKNSSALESSVDVSLKRSYSSVDSPNQTEVEFIGSSSSTSCSGVATKTSGKAISTGALWLENLGKTRREAEKAADADAAENKLKKLRKEFVVEDFRKNSSASRAESENMSNFLEANRINESRMALKSSAQVGTMGAAVQANASKRPPSSSVYGVYGAKPVSKRIADGGGSGGLASDSLDIYQEGPKDFGSLDVGYTDYQEENKKRIQLASIARASTGVDLSALLGQARSVIAGSSSSTVPHPASKHSAPVRKVAEEASNALSSMEDFMNKVSIEKFYRHVLSIRLHEYVGLSKRSDGATGGFPKVPNRFISDDLYLDRFLPLLLAEVKSSIGSVVEKLIAAERRYKSAARDITFFSARCAHINRWIVSGHYNGSLSQRHLREKMMNDLASSASSVPDVAESSSLDEAHLVVKLAHKGYFLNKDDFVIVVNESAGNNRLNMSPSHKPLLSLEDLLDSRMFTVGVVVSSCEPSAVGNGRADTAKYSLLMLTGTGPSDVEEWMCMRLTNITTHLREWGALASVRQQTLMPLTPYILRASPVVSQQALVSSRDRIFEMAQRLTLFARNNVGLKSETGMVFRDSLTERLKQALEDLLLHRVELTVVKASGILETLKDLSNLTELPGVILQLAKDVNKVWRQQVREDHRSATIASMHGGCVVPLPADNILRICPVALPSSLWAKLLAEYNSSQLFAIKYVIEQQRTDIRQDTQISLIQGPPGTGKTKTILGMVAALLHLGINKKLPALPKSIEASAVGDVAYAAGAANKNRLLICAPSNAAVDELLTRLSLGILSSEGIEGSNEGLRLLKLVRLGNVSESSNEMIEEFTLERQTEDMLRQSKEWHDFVDVEQRIKIMLKRIESEMVDQEGKDKKMLKLLLVRLHQEKQRKKIEMDRRRCLIRFDLLDKADVVLATLSGAGSHHFVDYIEGNIGFDAQDGAIVSATGNIQRPSLQEHRFETVLIDEAAQATEPSTLIPLRYGCKRLVLVGDPRQLPATVLDSKAADAGLSLSLFERLERSSHEVVMLQIQYRMHPDIRQFPSEQFYDGNLVDSSSVQCMALASTSVLNYGESILLTRMEIPRFRIVKNGSTGKFKECSHQIPVNVPTRKDIAFFSLVERTLFVRTIEFFDISNSIEEKDQTNSKTLVNIMEAQFIVAMIAAMTTAIGDHKIGIITPYDGQKRLLRDLISEAGDLRRFMGGNTISAQRNQIEVNTVDGFQGREKDLIIISCVRTSKSSIGFLDDDRRMNVAITRAKKCLIVVGNADALRCSTSWNKFVTHCRDYNCLTTLMLTKK